MWVGVWKGGGYVIIIVAISLVCTQGIDSFVYDQFNAKRKSSTFITLNDFLIFNLI